MKIFRSIPKIYETSIFRGQETTVEEALQAITAGKGDNVKRRRELKQMYHMTTYLAMKMLFCKVKTNSIC